MYRLECDDALLNEKHRSFEGKPGRREVSHHCRDIWFQMMMNRRFLTDANELCRLGVGQLTAGFSSGKFTPLEVAQATLARAEQVQERFNAFSLIDVDAALAMAKESTTRWEASPCNHFALSAAQTGSG